MIRSGTILKKRNIAVVVANEPMPSVSRKLVTAPTPIDSGVGTRASVAGDAGAARRSPLTARIIFVHAGDKDRRQDAQGYQQPRDWIHMGGSL